MKIILFCLTICISSVLSIGSNPENFELSFRRISPIGGFTYGAINSIGEDADGFIWFGTVHGLYCYNTVDVQKFMHNPLDSTTIPGNSIRAIFCDSNGTLWIGTSQGLCIYDKSKNQFITLNLTDKESGEILGMNIRSIFQMEDKSIFLLSASMLGKFNPELNHFEKICDNDSLNENFTCIEFNENGNIWIGGSNGTVWLYDSSKKQIHKFCGFRNESIGKIFATDSGIWIGYSWAGLDYSNLQGDLITHYGGGSDDINRIHHNRVRDIYQDEKGRIWVTTYKGISIITEGKIYNVLPQEISGIPYNSIYKIFKDSKNGIWIGTWSGGLAYQSNFDNRFIHSGKEQRDSEINDEFVSSFAEKNDGTILIGTEFGNLNKLNRELNRMINIPLRTKNNKKIENIKSLLFDNQKQTLWVGTFLDGLWFQKSNESVLHQLKKFNESRVSIYALAMSDSFLFIGTYGNGLYLYNTVTEKMKQFLFQADDTSSISNNNIRSIIIGKDKTVWIGTNHGLNHFYPGEERFERFTFNPGAENGISGDEIFTLQQDRQGIIWIGTSGGGINKFNPETNIFECYTVKNGLVGNDVYGIEEDNKGMLWISTDNGISNFDPYNKIFRNFYREDELQGNQFNPGAVFQASSGEIFFGDTKGFTFFSPEQMKTNPFPPQVILTSLSINNIPVDSYSSDPPLTKALQLEKELNLSYNQNSLTFYFVANNFLLPNKNRFKYRLINYDKNWIEAGSQNFATYTKIPPGEYVLEVIACNNDNLWNNSPTQLKIIISPPFWLSWYAYLTYLVILGLIIYFIFGWALERQRFKKELLLERYAHESQAQLQELKLRFFTNIAHEFRTPLTLIASPINQLLEKFRLEKTVREHLLTMQRNSNRLLRLINQLIDIRKIELGKSVLNRQNMDLIALCRDVISNFENELKDKEIQLFFSSANEKLPMYADSEKVDKILFNLLSNAVKFTHEKGEIRIVVYESKTDNLSDEYVTIGKPSHDTKICIEFTDCGPGIPENEINLIFERFEQGKKSQASGTGIGLHMALEYTRMHNGYIKVKSKIGLGSTFVVCLPLTDSINQLNYLSEESDLINLVKHPENLIAGDEIRFEKEKTFTILIIEDNFELRDYLKNLLGQQYRVVTCSNGKQGLETAFTILPDMVITDVMMPQMDGFEVCKELKNNVQSNHIPVVLLTALNEPEKQIDGFKTGADAYISKPFDENVLLAQIENIIRSRVRLKETFSFSDTQWANEMDLLSSDRLLIEKATSIIEKHLNEKTFTLEELANKLGISSSSLYRKLKLLTNQSPTEFVRYIRLKKALKLMKNGNSNVDEISYSIGFNSHSYFTSSFKKQFGKTPTEYINDLRLKERSTKKSD